MEVHKDPEASDTNTFAEKGKSETFTEYHGISRFAGRKLQSYQGIPASRQKHPPDMATKG